MDVALQQLVNLLQLGSIYALLAIGFSIVYGIVGLVNFAHGDIFMVATYVLFFLSTLLFSLTSSTFTVLFATLIISAIIIGSLAVLIERVAYKPLRNAPKVSLVVTALAVGLLLQHLVLQFIGPSPQRVPKLVPDVQFKISTINIELYQILIIVFALFVMLLLNFFIRNTRTGIAMRGVSQDPLAASLMGISRDRIISLAFVLGSAIATVSAVLYGMAYPIFDPYIGQMINWWSFTAAVLGGIGDIRGAVLGGFLLAAVMVISPIILPVSSYRDIVAFGFLIFVLLVKPSGLLGKKSIKKV